MKWKTIFLSLITFGFFVCSCHSRRTHYPTIDKPGAQNIYYLKYLRVKTKVCNANWVITENLFKRFWKNITEDDTKKTKSLTEMQVLTKEFTSYNIKYKSLRKKKKNYKWVNMKYFCSKLKFWCACISHVCCLFCNIVLHKYKKLVKTWRGISVLKNFLKHLCWGHFLTKLQVSRSEHRYFKWTLQNFSKSLIYRTSWMTAPVDSSVAAKVLSIDHILFVFPSFFSFYYW